MVNSQCFQSCTQCLLLQYSLHSRVRNALIMELHICSSQFSKFICGTHSIQYFNPFYLQCSCEVRSKDRQDSNNSNNKLDNKRQVVVRRFKIAIHLDLTLILKLWYA
ncbi:hypothetical protein L1987_54929 [Smallanthus sonchifolius]|uniref:Uncharacterized protein n=1 Tax=Smallanthus sonchifolius TaxID=185202 RepID=A0ACB9E8B0_9ASTR|nr:hypothetical protein L1987_54929 [Smallanthus sonchifolius]